MLSEKLKDKKMCDLTLNVDSKKPPKLIDTDSRLVVISGGRWGWVKWVEMVQSYKLPVIK